MLTSNGNLAFGCSQRDIAGGGVNGKFGGNDLALVLDQALQHIIEASSLNIDQSTLANDHARLFNTDA